MHRFSHKTSAFVKNQEKKALLVFTELSISLLFLKYGLIENNHKMK